MGVGNTCCSQNASRLGVATLAAVGRMLLSY